VFSYTNTIELNIQQSDPLQTGIRVVQNDKDVYMLKIKVFNGLNEINYTDISSATITFQKADGKVVQGNIIKGETELNYKCGTNEISCVGMVKGSVQLFGSSGERLTTCQFIFNVVKDLIADDVINSTSEFPILQQVELNEVQRIMAETDRINAENSRVTAEINRTSQFDVIKRQNTIIPKAPVTTFSDVAITYTTPEHGWTVKALDTGRLYRYNVQTTAWEWIDTINNSAYDVIINEITSRKFSTPIETNISTTTLPNTALEGQLITTIKGNTIINLLGNDGDCENTTGWGAGVTLDSNFKVFGSNSFKCTISSGIVIAVQKSYYTKFDKSKYYCLSGYIANGNATNVRLACRIINGATSQVVSNVVTTNTFTRVFVKIKPNDVVGATDILVQLRVDGAVGQYGNFDGIQLTEISASEYADSAYSPPNFVNDSKTSKNFRVSITSNKSAVYIQDDLNKLNGAYDEIQLSTGMRTNRISGWLTLDGSLGWTIANNATGYKQVSFPLMRIGVNRDPLALTSIKYDGVALQGAYPLTKADQVIIDINGSTFFVGVNNTDTGWADTLTPSDSEIKAYFYGWKMCNNDGTSPYSGSGTKYWKRIMDGTGLTSTLPTASYSGYTPYKLIYKLATPIITEATYGQLTACPNGSITIEPIIKFISKPIAGVITIPNINYPIKLIESLRKITNTGGQNQFIDTAVTSKTTTTITPQNVDNNSFYEVIYAYDASLLAYPTLNYSYPMNIKVQVEGNTNMLARLEQESIAFQGLVLASLLNIENRLIAGGH
jgi:hypothetical protein